ncbi:MAG TPA: peptidase [Acidobacteria bacterium]|nr:peptidase [Acidobacteriota bacterium]
MPALGLVALLSTVAAGASTAAEPAHKEAELKIAPDVAQRLAQFSPTALDADTSALSEQDHQVLAKLVEASKLMNEIFLRQAWAGNVALRDRVAGWTEGEKGAARQYFELMVGPWDRQDERKPFLGDFTHPPGAGGYPDDLTREEFERWIAAHPADAERFRSDLTVIRRQGGDLVAIPYSQEFRPWLEPAAKLLREAAALTGNASLKKFLELRADAFLNDDYYASDFAWMDLESPVEVTIGPYETYEDELFGYKASFESFVTVNVPKESAALAHYKGLLPWLERNLPLADEHKNFQRGSDSPIRVVDIVYGAGETRAGVQTVAFNLPNDERVRQAKGSKKVLLRNVMRAKYDKILEPIAKEVLVPEQVGLLSFQAFYDEVLHHELSHGLGPGKIKKDGKETEVRLELKDLYSTLEEAKADVMGVYNILALIEKGDMPKELRQNLEPTYVAGLFRSARFGVDEAHGQGVVAQFNYLTEKGALVVDAQARFRTVPEKFPGALRDLLHEMLMLQANGDYEGTRRFLDKYGKASDSLRAAIARLTAVPVDIRPLYAADR